MHVLMVGVGPNRVGGMLTVSENYYNNECFCKETNLKYVATSTNGSIFKRLLFMLNGFLLVIFTLFTENIDIVHVHMASKGSVYRKGIIIGIAKLFKCKIIIHIHTGSFKNWYMKQHDNKQKQIRKILDAADKVLVLGEYWKMQMIDIVDCAKINILYNGVNVPLENLFNKNAKNVIYMGVMKKEKGIYDLLLAIKLLDKELSPDICVQLCGNDLEGDIEKKIIELELENRVKLLGWISSESKNEVYHDAMICVLPSYFEGLSMTIIEAMAMGIPIITTDISTMPEILGGDIRTIKAGDIDSLAEYLLELISDNSKLLEMSMIEYKRAYDIFNLDRNIEKLLGIYNSLMP